MDSRVERVVVETDRHRIVGDVTLPREGYRSRLSEYLNRGDLDFIPMVNAELTPLNGGSPETLTALVEAIERRWPGARVVGAESPPFRDLTEEEQEAQDQRIRASGADLVWVGLGTPRQDGEVARLARSVKRPAIGIGAAFDFVAGTRAEAPVWVQRLALEWLFRFASEPRRLWRRYTIGIAGFLLAVLAGEPKDGATPRAAGFLCARSSAIFLRLCW